MGTTRLAIISDTHAPRFTLPEQVWASLEAADLVVHAGDWMDPALLDEVERRCVALLACWGNNDGPDLRARLPEVARADLGGLTVTVTHETGAATGRERRVDRMVAGWDGGPLDLLVFGHSHLPWDSVTPGGVRLLNPGSPTDPRRQPHGTWLTASVVDGVLTDLEQHAVSR